MLAHRVFVRPRSLKYALSPLKSRSNTPSSARSNNMLFTRFQSQLQVPQKPLPIEILKKIETTYTSENIMKVLDAKDLLLSPSSVMITVVIGFTNQQLRILKAELTKPSEERDFEKIDDSLQYLKDISKRFRKEKKLREIVRGSLENDLVNISIFIQNPSSVGQLFQSDVSKTIYHYKEGGEDKTVGDIISLMSLYSNLTTMFKQSWAPVFSLKHFGKFVDITLKSSKTNELYKALIEYGSPIVKQHIISPIRYKLIHGSQKDQYLYEFQEIFETKDQETLKNLKARFVKLYTFQMIRQITTKYINRNDEKAATYLDLLVTKASIDMESANTQEETNQIKAQLYECIIYRSVRQGNYKNALPMLDQITNSGLKLTPKIFHSVFTSLRKKKFYDAVLMLLRSAPEEFLKDESFKEFIISDFLVLLRNKFPDNPVMVLSHYITIFENSEILLNEIGILSLMLPAKTVGKLSTIDSQSLIRASLPSKLIIGEQYPTIRNITTLYAFTLNYMSRHHSLKTIKDYMMLFNLMMKHVKLIQAHEESQPILKNHPFSSTNYDDAILNIFLDRVLKDFKKPSVALKMVEMFLTTKHTKFDPAFLTKIFSLHNDDVAYQKLILMMEQYGIQPDFPYISGQIFKSYNAGDVQTSKKWYEILCSWKFPIKSGRLIRFIDKNGWEFPEEFDKRLLDMVLRGEDPNSNGLELYENEEEEIHDDEFIDELKNKLALNK